MNLLRVAGAIAIGAMLLAMGGCDDSTAEKKSEDATAAAPAAPGSLSNPNALTVGTPFSSSVAANGPVYFKFTTGGASAYSVSLTATASNLTWEIFTDAGFTASNGWCDTSKAAGPADEICFLSLAGAATYYVAVKELDGVAGTFAIAAATGATGALADGLRLTLGSAFTTSMAAFGTQHYQFKTGSAGTYTVSLTGTSSDLSYSLFSDRALTSWLGNCDTAVGTGAANEICNQSLPANTNMIVRVDEWDSVSGGFTITPLSSVSGVPVTGGGTPVLATLGANYPDSVPANGSKYYAFTTGAAGGYTVSVTGLTDDLDLYIYADAGFTYLIGFCAYFPNSTSEICYGTLNAGATYYVEVFDLSGFGSAFTFNAMAGVSGNPW